MRRKILSEMVNKTVCRGAELHIFCSRISLTVFKYDVVRMLISVDSEWVLGINSHTKSNDLLSLACPLLPSRLSGNQLRIHSIKASLNPSIRKQTNTERQHSPI